MLLVGTTYSQSTVKLIYQGYVDEIYVFEEADGTVLEFDHVASKLVDQFELHSTKAIEKGFLVTYKTELEYDDDMEYEVYSIIDMSPTKVVRIEDDEW